MNILEFIDMKYPKGLTLRDILGNKKILDMLENNYVPDFIFEDYDNKATSCFMNPHYIVKNKDNMYKAYFVYIKPNGEATSIADMSYIQIPAAMNGFLARFSTQSITVNPDLIEMDYIIDMNNIICTLDSTISANKDTGEIYKYEILKFESISVNKYPEVSFDPVIMQYQDNRKMLGYLLGI